MRRKAVTLSAPLVSDAETYGKLNRRSKASQIEHWARNGKLVEENPELPFSFIQEAILSHKEIEAGQTMLFVFSSDSK